MSEKPCTFLVRFEKRYPIAVGGIKADLKYGDAAAKAGALKQALAFIINGDTSHFRDLSIISVRDVLPCEDLKVQKLVLLYLETVYKGDDVFGRVPPDMNLIRDYLCQNLQHRDEYIRGLTLRLISRFALSDLLEPLAESVLVNLYHRHRFVRRHAYSAVFAIYLHLKPDGLQLLPDTLDRVAHEFNFERDAAAMRNALLMLCTCAPEQAVAYLLANADGVVNEWPDIVQVVSITLIRRACCSCCSCCCCSASNEDQGKLTGIIIALSARSSSYSVVYEAADALLSLCSEPVAVCAAANAYFKLLFSLTDTDVKRIVLERLLELGIQHDYFVKTIESPSPNPNPNPNMMNIEKKVLLVEIDTTKVHIDSVDTIGSPSPNTNMMNIEKKVLLVELDTTKVHIDSVDTIGRPSPNVMNIKSLPIADKVLLAELARKQGDKVQESNCHPEPGSNMTLAIHA